MLDGIQDICGMRKILNDRMDSGKYVEMVFSCDEK